MVTADARPVVLLWGESTFLLREAALERFGGVQPLEVAGGDWRPELTADLATPSLFGEERAVLVADAQDLPPEGAEEVGRYARAPATGARLVLTTRTGPRARGPAKALLGALGESVEVQRVGLDRKQLPEWIRRRAAAVGLGATPAGAAALVQTLGEDPAVLAQAVEQLAASHPVEGITAETVAAQFRGLGDRRTWELTDAAFVGDLAGAMRVLAGLLDAGEEPLLILGGIASRVRDLLRVASLPPRMPLPEIARAAGLRFDWQARRFRDQARRFGPGELAALHEALVDADGLLKQGAAGDVVLAMVVSSIASAGERGTRARARAAR